MNVRTTALTPAAKSELLREYWAVNWHHASDWPAHRLACFLSAEEGRRHDRKGGDGLVVDEPSGRRPLLGVLTNSYWGGASRESGALEYNQAGHLLTVAPTRAGKGVSQIIPNLLLYAGSCLVIDIKGENYDKTARYRQSFFDGAQVFKFAPFEDDTSRYNPLDFIRVGEDGQPIPESYDDTRLLAEMLIPSRNSEDFWDIEARNCLTMILFYVATSGMIPERRTMREVVNLLFPVGTRDDKSPIDRTIMTIRAEAERAENMALEAMVTQFREHDDKVRAGILSTCRSAMAIWLSERLLYATSKSDFDFNDLKRSMCRPIGENPAPTSIYVVIPPEYLREYRAVLRMIVGLASVGLTRAHPWDNPDDKAKGWRANTPCPVLFFLDEFAALGHMSPIEQGVAYLAGYGVQLWTFVQSLGQLKDVYKENWTTFVSNAGAACYYGIADPDLCAELARQLGKAGEYEIEYHTTSVQEGSSYGSSGSSTRGTSRTTGDSYSWSSSDSDTYGSTSNDSKSVTVTQNKRWKEDQVAEPSDIRRMAPSQQLIMLRNKRPALASLVRYFDCNLFKGRYDDWRGTHGGAR
ncbi:type IV secretory system conjugative DNA transfer family protein [Agrobacterium pusense]|uniref:type IV secretory system conjugative DNA transfer family protein n=1 Tax=Agrobacterium pusense TaxID=648995 RepID=UPI000690BBA2|nr:type IV secretory system conjugative DNA transfer family protein [Agrobacterium pusense]ANV25619.1 hypothetical protein BA939_16480 [Rhizobium sp. S41]QWW77735.1 type IV secretory system conjugative DNA transfer family protein [Agrobacterium pusense]